MLVLLPFGHFVPASCVALESRLEQHGMDWQHEKEHTTRKKTMNEDMAQTAGEKESKCERCDGWMLHQHRL
jgi:hypothetical protein